MRKLLALAVVLSACSPAGYYVANVYSANGGLVQEKCEISGYNRRPDPDSCHLEPVQAAAAVPYQGGYPAQAQPPQQPYPPQPPPPMYPQQQQQPPQPQQPQQPSYR